MAGNTPALSERNPVRILQAIRDLFQGRSNAVGEVTLTASAATTTVAAANCGSGSEPVLFPKTAHASAELGNGTIYVSSIANGSFVITHANNSQTDRKFSWVCLG